MENLSFTQKRKMFLELFPEVVTPVATTRDCGQEKCTKLILLARQLGPGFDYGDPETGSVEPAELFFLHSSLS